MELGSSAIMPLAQDSLLARELALVFRNTGVRTGACAGVALAIVLTVWLYLANRAPSLEAFAAQRNLVAATAFALSAAIPVLRFLRAPGNLLVAGLIACSILGFTYRALCIHFSALAERYSAIQIFTLGTVVYMLLATLSWVATSVWRLRESGVSHPNHESHISHSNHHI
jgi:hypothetical protein